MTTLSRQYAQFTPEERIQLTLAAAAREDGAEVKRLMASCPKMTQVVPDPRYYLRLPCLLGEVRAEILRWVEPSMHVVCHHLLTPDIPDPNVARVAKANAVWKQLSALWRGIESGLKKFCAETDLSWDHVVAEAGPLPTIVTVAARVLHAKARPDIRVERAVRQRLQDAWQVPEGAMK